MTLAAVRNELRKLRTELVPSGQRVVGALAWGDHVRMVLFESGMNRNVCTSLSELPPGVRIFRVNPAKNLGMVFLGADGGPHLQIIAGIGEHEMWPEFCTDREHCRCDQ
jgi:hypothetical protein